MTLTASHCCSLSLTVSSGSMELLHVSYCLLWLLHRLRRLPRSLQSLKVASCLSLSPILLLAVSQYLSDPMELLAFSYFLPLFLAVSHCLLYCASHCLLYGCWLALTVSLVASSCRMSLTFSYGCWLPLTLSYMAACCLSQSPIVSGCHSLSLPVLFSCCMSLIISYS